MLNKNNIKWGCALRAVAFILIVGIVPISGLYLTTLPWGNGVEIRIQNDTGGDIESFLLGEGAGYEDYFGGLVGRGSTRFDDVLLNGETSQYKNIKNDYRYFSRSNFRLQNEYFSHALLLEWGDATEYVNLDAVKENGLLPEGRYTFAYSLDLISGGVILTIIKDAPA